MTDHTDTLPFGSRLYDATDTEKFTIFSKDDLHRLENALYVTTRDAPDVSMPITLRFPENGWEHEYMLAARALWSSDAKPRYLGAVGQFREMQTISCCRKWRCRIPALSPADSLRLQWRA